jgi:hypothetical protein
MECHAIFNHRFCIPKPQFITIPVDPGILHPAAGIPLTQNWTIPGFCVTHFDTLVSSPVQRHVVSGRAEILLRLCEILPTLI